MSILKDPLIQVLIGGIAIYLLYLLIVGDTANPNQIRVDKPALLEFVRNRSQAYEEGVAEARLEALSEDEMQALISAFVREQALHREALNLGLDRDDYVMQRRLVQRLESSLEALAKRTSPASEEELAAYFDRNREHYCQPDRITFTHVFLDPKRRSEQSVAERSAALLADLRKNSVQFSEALSYGDPFVYHRNYVDRPRGDIVSHFGEDMARALFSLDLTREGAGSWIGPFKSIHGMHLVLIENFVGGGIPQFTALRLEIERDFLREQARQRLDATVQRIIEKYPVTLELDS